MYDEEMNHEFHEWTAEYLSRRMHRDKLPKLKKKKDEIEEEEESPSK